MDNITKEQKDFLDGCTNGTWKLNTETGLVDIPGDFNCFRMGLSDFMGIEFGNISGSFDCSSNKLTSLEGSPQKVGESFYCSNNQLVSLEGGPREIGWCFYCYNNKLVSLDGFPQKIDGKIYCDPISLRRLPINLLDSVYFTKDRTTFRLSSYIKYISDLYPDIYLKKMIL